MLFEIIKSLTVQCPKYARKPGLAKEHAAIYYRYKRNKKNWKEHLENSKGEIKSAIDECDKRDLAIVIGAGSCLDIPIDELAIKFKKTLLTDVVISREFIKFSKNHKWKIFHKQWDATGGLEALYAENKKITPARAVTLLKHSPIQTLIDEKPDLIISANCLSQLGLVPLSAINIKDISASEKIRLQSDCIKTCAKKHLNWLAKSDLNCTIISDQEIYNIYRDNKKEVILTIPELKELRKANKTWLWNIAPKPEISKAYDRLHKVCSWKISPWSR